MANISVFHTCQNELGEGLFFTCQEELVWLDISRSLLAIKKKNGEYLEFPLPEQASAIWKKEKNTIFLASESGLCTYDLSNEEWKVIQPIIKCLSMRANDGGTLNNTFVFGTMQKSPKDLAGSLYITNGKYIEKIYSGIGIPNSFIHIGRSQLLISDSFEQIIYRFDFDMQEKKVINRSIWLDLTSEMFTPDGGCIDSNGHLYIAMWDGSCVNKYNKKSHLIESYSLPVPRPTNCILSLDEKYLYISTAREGLSKEQLSSYPLSGSILKLKLKE